MATWRLLRFSSVAIVNSPSTRATDRNARRQTAGADVRASRPATITVTQPAPRLRAASDRVRTSIARQPGVERAVRERQHQDRCTRSRVSDRAVDEVRSTQA